MVVYIIIGIVSAFVVAIFKYFTHKPHTIMGGTEKNSDEIDLKIKTFNEFIESVVKYRTFAINLEDKNICSFIVKNQKYKNKLSILFYVDFEKGGMQFVIKPDEEEMILKMKKTNTNFEIIKHKTNLTKEKFKEIGAGIETILNEYRPGFEKLNMEIERVYRLVEDV